MISTGYGIDLVMPDGFSVVEHESVRECEFAAYGGNKITKNNDNRFRFNYVISSASNMVAAGSDVVTQRVRLKIDKSVAPGDYAIVVTNSEIVSETGAAGTMKRPDDIYCRVTLQSKPVVTATTTCIDLRGFSDVFGLVDVSANPNVIIYANEGQVENENNVVVDVWCLPINFLLPFLRTWVSTWTMLAMSVRISREHLRCICLSASSLRHSGLTRLTARVGDC